MFDFRRKHQSWPGSSLAVVDLKISTRSGYYIDHKSFKISFKQKKKILEDFEIGQVVFSEEFEIMYKSFILNIYPNGSNKENEGHVSLYLEYHPHWYKGSGDQSVKVKSLKITTEAGVFRLENNKIFQSGSMHGFPKWLPQKAFKENLVNGSFKFKIEAEIRKDQTSWSFPQPSEVIPKEYSLVRYLVLMFFLICLALYATITRSLVFGPQCDKEPSSRRMLRTDSDIQICEAVGIFLTLVKILGIVFCILWTLETGRRLYAASQMKDDNISLPADENKDEDEEENTDHV